MVPLQYVLKGTNLRGYAQRELNTIVHWFNARSRKCLNWADCLRYSHNCVIIHPMHLELETDALYPYRQR